MDQTFMACPKERLTIFNSQKTLLRQQGGHQKEDYWVYL